MEYKLSEKQFNQLQEKGFALNFSESDIVQIVREKQLILIKESKPKFSNEEMKKFGNHLKSIRRDTGLSRVEFGNQISVGGVSIPESAIKEWEEGNTLIPEKELNVYLKKFGNDTLLSKIYTKPNSKKSTIISNKNISQEMKDFMIKRGLNKHQFIALFEQKFSSQTIEKWIRGIVYPKNSNKIQIKKIINLNKFEINRILSDKNSRYSIGERIEKLMESNEINATGLGELLEVNHTYISKLRNGYLDATEDQYKEMAEIFDVTVEYLKTGKNDVKSRIGE